ncbi:MAG: hypothetical protein ABJD97_04310 [Betaproteobacteria bacterium]
MSVMTHDTKWRLLIGAAPVIGVAFFVWAAAQGEANVASSPTARVILAGVAAIGTVVAWWTARQLRAAPALPVAEASRLAQAGQLAAPVAMRGRARALPDAVPLVSPDGELCLWFKHGEQFAHQYSAVDSVRPFLLVDDSGECIVLPAGADVTGSGHVAAKLAHGGLPGQTDIAGSEDLQSRERLLRDGDRIHVVGRFVAASAEALALQEAAAALVARTEFTPVVVRSSDPPPFRDLRSAALAGAPFVTAPPRLAAALPLPVIAAPGASQPFIISIGSDDGEGALYGLLAVVDCTVLVVASSLVASSIWMPG